MLAECGAVATFLHSWKEYKYLYNHFGKQFLALSSKVKYIHPHPIIILVMHQIYMHQDTCTLKTSTKMFIAALFVIVQKWKPNRSLTVEWINKLWYIHTIEQSRG